MTNSAEEPGRTGVLLSVVHASATQIFATIGYDVVVLDQQHGGYTRDDIRLAAALVKGTRTEVWVRVPVEGLAAAEAAVEVGASGVVFPMVESPEAAARAAVACRRPPAGRRSIGGQSSFLAGALGAAAPLDAACVVQVESAAGVDRAAEVLSVDGVDGLWVGVVDLANSLGHPVEYGGTSWQDVAGPAAAEAEAVARSLGQFVVETLPGVPAGPRDVRLVATDLDLLFRAGREVFRRARGGPTASETMREE